MNLKVYKLTDPRTDLVSEVYEYPKIFLPSGVKDNLRDSCIAVSKEVMKFPVLCIPAIYLTEQKNQRIGSGFDVYVSMELSDYFYNLDENISPEGKFNRFLANIITQLVVPNADRKVNETIYAIMESSENGIKDFSEFVKVCFDKKYSWNYIKEIIGHHYQFEYYTTYKELVEMFPFEEISRTDELDGIIDAVLLENVKSVEDYRKGKKNSINYLKGQVMRATKGKANSNVVNIILDRKLNS